MTENVLFSIHENGVASITLNRPKALNSLSYDMLHPIGQKLKEWEKDDRIAVVILKGAGTKGFCAGGDIKTLYEARSNEVALQHAEHFFEEEYEIDTYIYHYPKPIIACLDGIVMGGGVGLTNGAKYRIVTDRTKWAMPEMNIGFFPDVGAAYFLNKAPGQTGRYVALTASVLKAADVLYIKAADHYMPSETLPTFLDAIEKVNWHDQNIHITLKELINKYETAPSVESELVSLLEEIDQHFSFHTVEDIIHSLDNADGSFASKTKETLLSKSPFSLKVTLKQLIDGKEKSIEECFATDLVLAKNFMRHEDFFEGVRSVVVDKDQNPKYKYKQLSDVSDEDVNRFFNLLNA
ncbi:enoyl-CoA hydratase/isomerase family protein [Bacillus pseudomycoides]|uniref:3-hydroxyisobutyryl-CoA hydrolase n=1 Tax=Bacillus pseudomycoides TaxID=64104 RepID=A0A2A8B600_9BACI|nr:MULTISPECIES: enoyl-CoA hydratase/isomerase family protein [Bacillus]EEM16978.1 Enoyl-CoA hydratase [Bacillus pseudomycoides DSM 12442]KFN15776.1 enoyl-CoA hydratase/isomerase family protein [Bacillus pseudomycoides]MBD5796519.1 3-hydroxyisobutyryl-CoA hydrolase [Bacillus pseudomycoides]MCR8859403.1 enoyl-CoA hydratase/isomerase family protein [Bacillus pseudomycoides]MCX2825139.1 enoyl-CoA hydratase/isomerase family protein [Bacillus sp. DHT2]